MKFRVLVGHAAACLWRFGTNEAAEWRVSSYETYRDFEVPSEDQIPEAIISHLTENGTSEYKAVEHFEHWDAIHHRGDLALLETDKLTGCSSVVCYQWFEVADEDLSD